jgi:hypothetical protein
MCLYHLETMFVYIRLKIRKQLCLSLFFPFCRFFLHVLQGDEYNFKVNIETIIHKWIKYLFLILNLNILE